MIFAELYFIRPWEISKLKAWEFDALRDAADRTLKEAERGNR